MATRARPTAPAMMPAPSESFPSVAETVSTVCGCSCTGRAPYFRTRARSLASRWVKFPVISPRPLNCWALIWGADCTTPSRSMATCF